MLTNNNQPLSVQCFNATCQGFFDRNTLEDIQKMTGTGIVIDDEFNFLMSNWKEDTLNGHSFMSFISGPIIYGCFQKNIPQGTMAYLNGKYKLFISKEDSKETESWRKEAVLIDTLSRIFYLLQLTPRDRERSMDLDRTQKIGSESFRSESAKGHWRIKIIDRCTMKGDGRLIGLSKKITDASKDLHRKYALADCTQEQQNHINLVAAVLGPSFQDPHIISPIIFLRNISNYNQKIRVQELREQKDARLFLTTASRQSGTLRLHEHKLGITMSLSTQSVKSLGNYDNKAKLNGIGVQFGRLGACILGVFREGLLVKEYCHNKQASKQITSVQARELLQSQHLKSINYINTAFYIPEIQKIIALGNRIVRYTEAFEKQFEKRHFSYNDTEISEGSETMNIMKYGEQSGARIVQQYVQEMEGEEKRPGFIFSKNKSKDREKSRSPVGTVVRQGSRSPGGREIGKISRGHAVSGRQVSGRKVLLDRRPAY